MFKKIAVLVSSVALAAGVPAYAEAEEAAVPNDAQIAQIVLTANTVDVNYGKLAVEKTSNAEVKAFAETMVRDHSTVNDQATELAGKLGVKPEASETSKSLEAGGKDTLAKLKKLSGDEFDRAYVDNEVSYHEAVISVLDETLIPNAENAELKALLEAGRPVFVAHLEHARKLQKALKE